MMNTNQLSELLLHYGRITSDISFSENVGNEKSLTRIRTFSYNGKHFYHHMVNGIVVECFELN